MTYRFDTPRFHDELKDRAMKSHRHSGASYHIPEQDSSGTFWTVVCVAGFLAFCGLCALAGMA